MKTPGVYIVEKNAFPNSVVEVATAVPAFIGYTETAKNGSKTLFNTPWKISSLAEYVQYFGGAPKPVFDLKKVDDISSGISSLIPSTGDNGVDQTAEIQKMVETISRLTTATANAEDEFKRAQNGTKPEDNNKAIAKSLQYMQSIAGDEQVEAYQKDFDGLKVEDDADAAKISTTIQSIRTLADKTSDKVARDKIEAKLVAAESAMKGSTPELPKIVVLLHDAIDMIARSKIIDSLQKSNKEKTTANEALTKAKIPSIDADPVKANAENAKNAADAVTTLQKAVIAFKALTLEMVDLNTRSIENVSEVIQQSKQKQFYSIVRTDKYNLYYHLRFFFANGGGPCYIVSAGDYGKDVSYENLLAGIEPLLKEQEPTMVLIPEAVYLSAQECYDLQQATLKHCGLMQNRIAILDVYDGDKSRKDAQAGDVILNFHNGIGSEFLDYAAAYYPWLNTSIVSEKDVSASTISNPNVLMEIVKTEAISGKDGNRIVQLLELAEGLKTETLENSTKSDEIHKVLLKQSANYASIMKEIVGQINLLPPSSAMAGIYTLVDHNKEVWKAPANITISNVISPALNISHADQEDLNVPLNGKAVNAIRYFVGEGVKVWGARTLDGNSLDWRYINVRRTMIMLEESIKNATKAYVFEPNTPNTWVSVRSMVSNFLNGIWKRGGLAGASPDDAFSVHIGLGDTMTPEDILEGIMKITVLVAIVRPAEFIEITFQQQMQKS